MAQSGSRGRTADIITLLALVALAVALSLVQAPAWTVDIEETAGLRLGNAAEASATEAD